MNSGQTLGTRSLIDRSQTKDYCDSKIQSGFAAEQFTAIGAAELDKLLSIIDTQATKTQTSRFRLELADAYCLRRDVRYGTRSRKWLFAKAQQTRLNLNFSGWVAFALENLDKPELKSLVSKSARELSTMDFKAVMKVE